MAKKNMVHNGIEIPEGGMDTTLVSTEVSENVVATNAGPQEVLETTAVFQVPESLSNKFQGMTQTLPNQEAGKAAPVNTEALKSAGLGNVGATSLMDSIKIVDGTMKLNPKTGKHEKLQVPSEIITMEQLQASAIKNVMHAPTSIMMGSNSSLSKKSV